MCTPQQFSLRWNNYSQHLITAFEDLRSDDDLTDVTLSCDGKRLKAHRVLLSACSLYFKETFRENPCKHPVVILNGVTFEDLQAVVTFMYNGQVNITQERLSSFLQTAELLQIKGLTDINDSSQSPSSKKRATSQSGGCLPGDAVIANNGNSTGTDDCSIISSGSNPNSQRSPNPKRKRIGPASFMQLQLSHPTLNDPKVPVVNQSATDSMPGSTGHVEKANNLGNILHPETVLLPSSTLTEQMDSSSSSDNESFNQKLIKYESGNGEDYDKSNASDANESQNDLLDEMQEHGSMGHFLAGPSSHIAKASGGVMESSGNVKGDTQRWLTGETRIQRRSTTESKSASSSPANHQSVHPEESTGSNDSNLGGNFSVDEGSAEADGFEIMDDDDGDEATSTAEDRNFSAIRGDIPPLKPIRKTLDQQQFSARLSYPGSRSSSHIEQSLQMFGITDPMYILKVANTDRQQSPSSTGASAKSGLPPIRPRSVSKAMSTGSQEYGPYICDICGKTYAHHRSLNDHKKSHTGATLCHYCLRSFSKVANLRAHVLAQHKDKITQTLAKIENLEQL